MHNNPWMHLTFKQKITRVQTEQAKVTALFMSIMTTQVSSTSMEGFGKIKGERNLLIHQKIELLL